MITRDNVTIKVTAVVYFKVIGPIAAVVNVVNFNQATTQIRNPVDCSSSFTKKVYIYDNFTTDGYAPAGDRPIFRASQ